MSRVIVLHGAHGGPDTNWFPWLRAELVAEGMEVLLPRFPTPEAQSLEAWFSAYDRVVNAAPPAPTILVGHSLGAAFALRLVERATEPYDGLFLAAGFIGALGLPDYDPSTSLSSPCPSTGRAFANARDARAVVGPVMMIPTSPCRARKKSRTT